MCFEGLIETGSGSELSLLDVLDCPSAWTVVALDYELGYLLEPAARPLDWTPENSPPLIRFWRFRDCQRLLREAGEVWLKSRRSTEFSGICEVQPAVAENDYRQAVDRIQQWISEGDCYQVNLTFPINFSWFGRPLDVYAALRERQPVRYGGFVGDSRGGIVSLSPELFVERLGKKLRTRPMKGTLPRSERPEKLRESTKDRAENLMIVDLLRNDLGRIAQLGSVKVEQLFEIEDYPTVWQMVSTVSAEVGDLKFVDLLRALFPCGSITGAPKIRAMQIAAELENSSRGIYTGTLGWIAPSGDCRLNVAIRTLELGSRYRGSMGVGSGIVADSDPASEWQECLLKSRFMREIETDLELIETLRRVDGDYPRLSGHLARLTHSAQALGFTCDLKAVRIALDEVPGQGQWRVRLSLQQSGKITVAHFPLIDESTVGREAVLSLHCIDADDPIRRHKTTARQLYDLALRAIANDPLVFDTVFLNQRGEVAEGARSTVFIEKAGFLLTPPLSSGALPGVLRAELLASGQAKEAIVMPEDLQSGFLLGNALRGLIPVRLRSTD